MFVGTMKKKTFTDYSIWSFIFIHWSDGELNPKSFWMVYRLSFLNFVILIRSLFICHEREKNHHRREYKVNKVWSATMAIMDNLKMCIGNMSLWSLTSYISEKESLRGAEDKSFSNAYRSHHFLQLSFNDNFCVYLYVWQRNLQNVIVIYLI